jgi:hypothetical protein
VRREKEEGEGGGRGRRGRRERKEAGGVKRRLLILSKSLWGLLKGVSCTVTFWPEGG